MMRSTHQLRSAASMGGTAGLDPTLTRAPLNPRLTPARAPLDPRLTPTRAPLRRDARKRKKSRAGDVSTHRYAAGARVRARGEPERRACLRRAGLWQQQVEQPRQNTGLRPHETGREVPAHVTLPYQSRIILKMSGNLGDVVRTSPPSGKRPRHAHKQTFEEMTGGQQVSSPVVYTVPATHKCRNFENVREAGPTRFT